MLTIVLVIMTAIIGAGAYVVFGDADKTSMEEMRIEDSSKKEEISPTTAPSSVNNTGSYIDYSDGVIESTSGTKLLFFHAPWCPQCRALDADIRENGVPEGVTIIKVDYDTNQSLRQKYGVTIQTTVVKVDDVGSLVEKFVAYDEPSLSAVRENLL